MADVPVAAGYVVADRYRLDRRLGEGGMGAVWVAEDMTLRSEVAIKLLHGTVQNSEDGLKRFLREAQAAARLRSPHVVQILEHGVDKGVPFIAMELLEGESLAARIARLGTLSLAQTARIVTHVARAIGKAHDAGIVHRDLKPDNIFIVHNDDEEIVKVFDFGIAKMEQHFAEPTAKISTQEGSLLGTPLYMSPEQVRGHGVDWRSDLWSLAMITFECVCGRLPFDGRTVGDILVLICSEPLPVPSSIRPLPPAFDAWFARAASRDVAKRFQSAKEMADGLRAMITEDSRTSFPSAVDSGEVRRVSVDALTMDAAAAISASAGISALEHARTVSASGTMSGASSAIRTPARKPFRLIAGVLAALSVFGVALWFGRARLSTASRAVPSETAALSTVTTATAAPTPVTPDVLPTSGLAPLVMASAAVVSASASVTPSAAASHARVATPARTAAPQGSKVSKSDELSF